MYCFVLQVDFLQYLLDEVGMDVNQTCVPRKGRAPIGRWISFEPQHRNPRYFAEVEGTVSPLMSCVQWP